MAHTVYSASELDGLLPETIIRLGNGLAAWKRDGIDWYISNDETDEFSGDAIEMCPGALPADVLWSPE